MDARSVSTLGTQHRIEHGRPHKRGSLYRPHPDLGVRACPDLLRLFRGLGADRAEAVETRARAIGALASDSVASVLQHNSIARADTDAESPIAIAHARMETWALSLNAIEPEEMHFAWWFWRAN
jgi:hypothetical protein